MILISDEFSENTYRIAFQEYTKLEEIATIRSIGIENRQEKCNYYWDCNNRLDHETFIFQYTLSGCGEIKINGEVHSLPEGSAFMASVPSDCQYYLPESSEEWRFIFITLVGEEAKRCWDFVNEKYGQVFNIADDNDLIQQLISIYVSIIGSQPKDSYGISSKAYEFITHCYRHFELNPVITDDEMPDDIKKALLFIEENFANQLSVDEISEYLQLSNAHLSRKFKLHVGMSPLNYLNNFRIKKAINLLKTTQKSIKDISELLGYSDANYFCKVFRKTTGIAPNFVRKGKLLIMSLLLAGVDLKEYLYVFY